MVRPWKAPSAAIIRGRPVSLAILNAASLASAPELQKITRPLSCAPLMSSSRSASASTVGWVKKFDTCPRVATCSETACTMAGWAWPSALTAMPPSRSRYCLPSASVTTAPCPLTSSTGGTPKLFIRACDQRSAAC